MNNPDVNANPQTPNASAPCPGYTDPTDDPAYQIFVNECAKYCTCQPLSDEEMWRSIVSQIQLDAKESGIELATDLYQSACTLMRNQRDDNCWHNLQNAAARWDAARQSARNDAIASNNQAQ